MNILPEEQNSESVHLWNHCHNCGAAPIVGIRHECTSCPAGPDNDLCETCFEKFQKGEIEHPRQDSPAAALDIKTHHFTPVQGKPAHLFEHWLPIPLPEVPGPRVPDRFVVRPVFCSGADVSIGGYAFLAAALGHRQPLLLTALHVLDEMIKKKGLDCTDNNQNYTGRELPGVISEVQFYDVFAANWMAAPLGNAAPMLVLPGARCGDEEPYSYRDIAAFYVKNPGALNPASLAQKTPALGEPVWLAAKMPGESGARSQKAVVVEKTDRTFVFKFEEIDSERPKYTSGAPVLNKKGEVVGINVGGGSFRGQRLGHANHVESISSHLVPVI